MPKIALDRFLNGNRPISVHPNPTRRIEGIETARFCRSQPLSKSPVSFTKSENGNLPFTLSMALPHSLPQFPGYSILAQCGDGSFGTVYSALNESGRPVAIKLFTQSDDDASIQTEIGIHSQLHHPFIARVFGEVQSPDGNALVMERVAGPHLLDHILKNGPMSESYARVLFAQIVSAVHYLHTVKHIIHGDIKLENILLTKASSVRLIDFGLARTNTGPRPVDGISYPYASPEAILGMACTEAIDSWSLGVVLYAMVGGILPFGCEMSGKLVDAILEEKPKYPVEVSEKLKDLIERMLEKDADDRIDIEGVKRHPWLREKCEETWSTEVVFRRNGSRSDFRHKAVPAKAEALPLCRSKSLTIGSVELPQPSFHPRQL
jgi:serine/threonine protein kinase